MRILVLIDYLQRELGAVLSPCGNYYLVDDVEIRVSACDRTWQLQLRFQDRVFNFWGAYNTLDPQCTKHLEYVFFYTVYVSSGENVIVDGEMMLSIYTVAKWKSVIDFPSVIMPIESIRDLISAIKSGKVVESSEDFRFFGFDHSEPEWSLKESGIPYVISDGTLRIL